ncbi:DUF2380 domain-containing protein, partial [Corallococcus sp. AB018]
MRGLRWLLVGLLWSCASTSSAPAFSPEALWAEAETGSECADGDEDQCLAPWCVDGTCALFRCEDLEPGRVVRTRSALAPPVFVAPGSGPQRTWGSAQGLPGDAMPVMVFHWYPRGKRSGGWATASVSWIQVPGSSDGAGAPWRWASRDAVRASSTLR